MAVLKLQDIGCHWLSFIPFYYFACEHKIKMQANRSLCLTNIKIIIIRSVQVSLSLSQCCISEPPNYLCTAIEIRISIDNG